jgi:hypothetical protein
MLALDPIADGTQLESKVLYSCPTCKRPLAMLEARTVFAPRVAWAVTCMECVERDQRYRDGGQTDRDGAVTHGQRSHQEADGHEDR